MSIDSSKKGYLLVLALTMALLPCFNALRTNAATRGQEGAKAQEKTMTITGCLAPGATADVYIITDSTGTKTELTSNTVTLKSHLNHKVTVTGNMAAPGSDTSAPSRVEVTDLKMISTSC